MRGCARSAWVRGRIPCYATIHPDCVDHWKESGFFGVKSAAPWGAESGREGILKMETLLRKLGAEVGESMDIMVDCYLSWDIEFATRLAERVRKLDIRWFEYPLPNRWATESNKMLQVGIIGAGWRATFAHIPAVQAHPGANVLAVQCRTQDKAEKVARDFGVPHALRSNCRTSCSIRQRKTTLPETPPKPNSSENCPPDCKLGARKPVTPFWPDPYREVARGNGAREIVRKRGDSGVKETREICQKTEEPIVMNSKRGSRWKQSKASRQ